MDERSGMTTKKFIESGGNGHGRKNESSGNAGDWQDGI